MMPQKLLCKVADVQKHGEQVYSVFLKPENIAPRFLPGQFLHLALDRYTPGDFWPDSRIFSIASAPTERHLLRITYAVKGQFTSRMETELCPGRKIWVKMPYGEFIVNAKKDACLLAGGTGVTAFTAFLAGLPEDHSHPVHLFYGARRHDLLVYRSLIQTAAQRCPNLHVNFLTEQDSSRTDCLLGRIDLDLVWKCIPNPLVYTYYLSGPPTMFKILSDSLRERGVPASQVFIDAWE
jgi:ferredoxin-NADP reductase